MPALSRELAEVPAGAPVQVDLSSTTSTTPPATTSTPGRPGTGRPAARWRWWRRAGTVAGRPGGPAGSLAPLPSDGAPRTAARPGPVTARPAPSFCRCAGLSCPVGHRRTPSPGSSRTPPTDGPPGLRRELNPRAPPTAAARPRRATTTSGSPATRGWSAGAVAAARAWGAGRPARGWSPGRPRCTRSSSTSSPRSSASQSALVFSSGYLANLGVLTALPGPGTLVVSDRRNHASLIDACRLSRAPGRGRAAQRPCGRRRASSRPTRGARAGGHRRA